MSAHSSPRWVLRATTDYLDRECEIGRVHAGANSRGARSGAARYDCPWLGAQIAEVSAEQHVADIVEAVLAGLVVADDLPTPHDAQEQTCR